MLDSLSRDPPRKPVLDEAENLLDDPWEESDPVVQANSVPHTWKLPTEPHPLISAGGKLEALQLPAPAAKAKLDSARVLLQDELKLKALRYEKFNTQLKKALALLYWVRTAKPQLSV